MKYFSIKEISEMYGVSRHTIRYYEKLDMINPMRTEKNYRLYSINEIYKLNIIRDLRNLNVPLDKIKNYMETRTIDKTVELLRSNEESLTLEIDKLDRKLRVLRKRLIILDRFQSSDFPINEIVIEKQNKRQYVSKKWHSIGEDNFDEEVRKLCGEIFESAAYDSFNLVGTKINYTHLELEYDEILILGDSFCSDEHLIKVIESGTFASYFYRHGYEKTENLIHNMTTWLKQKGYTVVFPFYEFYLIDFHETTKKCEFLTELQVKIEIF